MGSGTARGRQRVAAVALLVGCGAPEAPAGDGHAAAPPPAIDCGSTVLVDDSAEAAAGMEQPADVLLDAASGSWSGSFEVDGVATDGDLAFLGEPMEVRRVPGVAPDCVPAYEATFAATVSTVDGRLDELLSGTLLAEDGRAPTLMAVVPADKVRGAIATMASGDLTVIGTLDSERWDGVLAWDDEDFGVFSVER